MPTVRSRVLLPDMFEPLTIKTRVASPSATSLRTQTAGWISGWPTASALKHAGPATSSGNGSAGFSAAYDASAQRASNSPIASSQWPISPARSRPPGVDPQGELDRPEPEDGQGHEELVPLVIEQVSSRASRRIWAEAASPSVSSDFTSRCKSGDWNVSRSSRRSSSESKTRSCVR